MIDFGGVSMGHDCDILFVRVLSTLFTENFILSMRTAAATWSAHRGYDSGCCL